MNRITSDRAGRRLRRAAVAAVALPTAVLLGGAPAISAPQAPPTDPSSVASSDTTTTTTSPAPDPGTSDPTETANPTDTTDPDVTVPTVPTTTPSQTPPPSPPDDDVQVGELYVSVFEIIEGEPSIIPNLGVTLTDAHSGATYHSPTPATITLRVSDYIISLDEVPDGYHVISIPRTIHLSPQGGHAQIVLGRDHTPPPPGRFTLSKLDRVHGTPLAGARFQFDRCDGTAVFEAVTDGVGEIEETLPTGCYVAREIAAPEGFVPEGNSYTFTVSSLRLTGLTVYNLPVDYTAPRDPEHRRPLSSIPAGPTERS